MGELTPVEATILRQIQITGACRIVDDVRWDPNASRYQGSLIWHGMPSTCETIDAFSEFVAERAASRGAPDVVVGLSSSGIAWATAAALRVKRTLAVMRLTPHKYGPWNAEVRRHAGARAWLIDNFLGSGESLEHARSLLRSYGIEPSGSFVVEARTARADVDAALTVSKKISHLLSSNYFDPTGTEIALRHERLGEDWLTDSEWVTRMRARITDNGCLTCE